MEIINLEKKKKKMSISQKPIFCYIKPKVLSKEETLQPKLERKRYSYASNIFKEKTGNHKLTQNWGQQQQLLVRQCQTERYLDKNYNKQGQLIIIVNRVERLKDNDEDSKSSLNLHQSLSGQRP